MSVRLFENSLRYEITSTFIGLLVFFWCPPILVLFFTCCCTYHLFSYSGLLSRTSLLFDAKLAWGFSFLSSVFQSCVCNSCSLLTGRLTWRLNFHSICFWHQHQYQQLATYEKPPTFNILKVKYPHLVIIWLPTPKTTRKSVLFISFDLSP